MRIKASVDYGIRTILYLAVKGGVCSSREISEEMTIPRDYLIQLALHLRRAGIIHTRPGKNGGYELAKSPAKISIGDIMKVFESDGKKTGKSKKRKLSAQASAVHGIESLVTESMNCYLRSITVADLVAAADEGGSPRAMIAAALQNEAERLLG